MANLRLLIHTEIKHTFSRHWLKFSVSTDLNFFSVHTQLNYVYNFSEHWFQYGFQWALNCIVEFSVGTSFEFIVCYIQIQCLLKNQWTQKMSRKSDWNFFTHQQVSYSVLFSVPKWHFSTEISVPKILNSCRALKSTE